MGVQAQEGAPQSQSQRPPTRKTQRHLGCPACGSTSAGRCNSIAVATTASPQDASARTVAEAA
eukprot:5232362-Alexandrium_andersonii.AAC.1